MTHEKYMKSLGWGILIVFAVLCVGWAMSLTRAFDTGKSPTSLAQNLCKQEGSTVATVEHVENSSSYIVECADGTRITVSN